VLCRCCDHRLAGKLKDLESKHRDVLAVSPRQAGLSAPLAQGGHGPAGRAHGAAGMAAAEYGPDAAIPWQPVGASGGGTRGKVARRVRFAFRAAVRGVAAAEGTA
jgi:hypothetical protein